MVNHLKRFDSKSYSHFCLKQKLLSSLFRQQKVREPAGKDKK